jgi:hypothetical protein
MRSIIRALVLSCSLISGCTPLIQTKDLISGDVAHAPVSANLSVAVAAVEGGESSENMTRVVANVEGAEYTEALRQTLGRAGLFRELSTEGNADVILRTRIISQRNAPHTTVYTLLVHYELRDRQTSALLWQGTFYSDAVGSDFYTDEVDVINRKFFVRTRAKTVQDNLSQLVTALSERTQQLQRR